MHHLHTSVNGGEIDNWMYPRHTGDFAFKIYVGKDGTSKVYADDNIPFTSDSYLKISAKGLIGRRFCHDSRLSRHNKPIVNI